MEKKLKRSANKMIAGVCGGLAEYLGMDATIVRVIYALLVLFGGVGILLYLILAAWIVIVNFAADMLNRWMDPRMRVG